MSIQIAPQMRKEEATDTMIPVAYFLFSNTLLEIIISNLATGLYSKMHIHGQHFFEHAIYLYPAFDIRQPKLPLVT